MKLRVFVQMSVLHVPSVCTAGVESLELYR
jgi:hypothetical protein